MENAWRVQWEREGRLKFKQFEGEKPTDAVKFAKKAKLRGVSVDVISTRRAYPPPLKQLNPPRHGMLWCPYCLKWKEFVEAAIQHEWGLGPAAMRCPTCTISVRDAFVRKYNPSLIVRMELELEARDKARQSKKQQDKKESPFGRKVRTIRR